MPVYYEPEWDGFLSAVYDCYKTPGAVLRRASAELPLSLFGDTELSADTKKAQKVAAALKGLSAELEDTLYHAWLSELEGIEDPIMEVLRLGFGIKANPLNRLTEDCVLRVSKAARVCAWEAQRMLQFVRFQEISKLVFVADIEPDCDVLPLIGRHFYGRFGDQSMMIRDLRRRRAILSKPGEGWIITELPGGTAPLPPLDEYARQWQMYIKTISNPARRNKKLQQHFIPLRYRKHMLEMTD